MVTLLNLAKARRCTYVYLCVCMVCDHVYVQVYLCTHAESRKRSWSITVHLAPLRQCLSLSLPYKLVAIQPCQSFCLCSPQSPGVTDECSHALFAVLVLGDRNSGPHTSLVSVLTH